MKLTVAQLAEKIGAELSGGRDVGISAVEAVDAAGDSDITFVTDDKHRAALEKSGAGAVLVAKRIEGLRIPQLVVENVDAALIEVLSIFAPRLKAPAVGIAPSATVGKNVKIADGVSVGPGAVIDDGARIGDYTVIGSGCKIGHNVNIGKHCRIHHNVVVYHNCDIGNNVIIAANTVIGSMGFGYVLIDGWHKLIPHNGGVVIEDFVEIGANCCVDRAKFGNTIIGEGTKIDNLVQIAHNVVIGKCCLIAGQVGIAGSSKLGDGVVLAGQVGIMDNIEIGSGTVVGAQAGVVHNAGSGQQLVGSPAIDSREKLRLIALQRRLPKFVEQIKQLTARVDKLEAAKDDIK